MARYGEGESEMRVGEVLKSARTRQGLDIRTIEERTKIRIKYLRALEAEEWEVLPNPAYASGFLRTYAQLLGLDAEALVDEYRRQSETEAGLPLSPVGERVLERGRRPGDPGGGPPLGLLAAIAGVVVIGILLVLGLTGGDDGGDDGGSKREAKAQRQAERRHKERQQQRRREQAAAQNERVTLRLEMDSSVTVCLLGDSERPLIDGQVLVAGSEEGPYEAKRFDLRFPSGYDRGQFKLFLDGEPRRLPETLGPVAFEIVPPDKVRDAPTPGPECP
jgi:transcriptional regulator with XRE-family HTH domain